ncbi:cytochrome c5 family protein [Alicycliphilus denitrificans]|uniref:Cytochrome c class I n=2 Tax=Alicycliphilus denitrificans TaxID=179636 RepID=F4GG37_ALIDK|nr:c-type cytochrome [Alicycliphilus denitrificans]ADU98223.1 cytochrome c class I [Alicycliphilus denitrificans BC]AEB82821.1 cytochrome c class I [Alicycliphilus denitrificans K601]QKD42504.1 cytochrome c5 family protein [Alicycliphilus denitrificans]
MSDTHDEAHSGMIKSPKQFLLSAIFAFVLPVFIIIGLVVFVTSGNKPNAGVDNAEMAIAQRLQKVGSVQVRDANRPLRSGEEVFKGQCAACHATGAAGAPKLADAAAWGPRIKTGFEALVQSALKGKGAMAPQGGGDFNDTEIARGVAYMANAAGAKFAEPAAPAAADAAPAAAPAAAEAPPAAAAAAPAAAAPAGGAGQAAGKAVYESTCVACHGTGVAGAPKFGDKAAWAPRLAAGFDEVLKIATQGKGAMPPKGGSTASAADFKAAVEYLVNSAK